MSFLDSLQEQYPLFVLTLREPLWPIKLVFYTLAWIGFPCPPWIDWCEY